MRLIAILPLLLIVVACNPGTPERQQLFSSADQVMPLFEGMPAPAFTLKRPDGSEFEFSPARLERPVVIYFYRGGWCPFCNAQLMELRRVEPVLEELGYDQLFISADSPGTLAQGTAEDTDDTGSDYTLLSDNDLVAARAFGIAFRLDDETLEKYEEYGIDLEAASGRDHHALPVPAVFIIDRSGLIDFAYLNPDYRVRLHPDILLAAARAVRDRRNVIDRQQDEPAASQD